MELHPVQTPGRRITAVHRPAGIDDAVRLLAEDPARRPLAGGTDLLLELHRGGSGPGVELIDLSTVVGFDEIVDAGDAFVLGGGVRHGQVVADRRFVERATPLAQACLEIGSPQLRNRATVAGNLVTASPANDSISALMALDASVELARWTGAGTERRIVPVRDFFTGFRSTVRDPEELVVSIRVPVLAPRARGVWVKLGNRRAQAISVIHAGFVVELDDEELVTAARLCFGSVAATVVSADDLAESLVGGRLDTETIGAVAAAAGARFEPIDDVRATAAYRRAAIVTLVERSLAALAADRHRDSWPDAPALGTRLRTAPASAVVADETPITVEVNGTPLSGRGGASSTLLDWLRHAGVADGRPLEGTKEGCAEGECGACTVKLNGQAVMSCLVSAAQADGQQVQTVEGLASGGRLHPVQQAFIDEFAVQCGFCIPGFLVAAEALIDEVPHPTGEQIDLGLSGNLCRCTGYYPIKEAVWQAAERSGTGSEARS